MWPRWASASTTSSAETLSWDTPTSGRWAYRKKWYAVSYLWDQFGPCFHVSDWAVHQTCSKTKWGYIIGISHMCYICVFIWEVNISWLVWHFWVLIKTDLKILVYKELCSRFFFFTHMTITSVWFFLSVCFFLFLDFSEANGKVDWLQQWLQDSLPMVHGVCLVWMSNFLSYIYRQVTN